MLHKDTRTNRGLLTSAPEMMAPALAFYIARKFLEIPAAAVLAILTAVLVGIIGVYRRRRVSVVMISLAFVMIQALAAWTAGQDFYFYVVPAIRQIIVATLLIALLAFRRGSIINSIADKTQILPKQARDLTVLWATYSLVIGGVRLVVLTYWSVEAYLLLVPVFSKMLLIVCGGLSLLIIREARIWRKS